MQMHLIQLNRIVSLSNSLAVENEMKLRRDKTLPINNASAGNITTVQRRS